MLKRSLLVLVAALSLTTVVGCGKSSSGGSSSAMGADHSKMKKASKTTKLGKTLDALTKEDLGAAITKAGYAGAGTSSSKSPGVDTVAGYGKKGDLWFSLVISAWEDPKTRATMVSGKKGDANVAVFEDGDYYLVVEAKEKDKPSGAKAKEIMVQLVGP